MATRKLVRSRTQRQNPQVGDYELKVVRVYPNGRKRLAWRSLSRFHEGVFYMDADGYWFNENGRTTPPASVIQAAKKVLSGKIK
jgi:hypothetical protein